MSLLQKRKFSESVNYKMPKPVNSSTSSEGLIYCLSMMSVVNMTFGNPIYDNYFEGVKTVIGPKKTQAIFNELKNRDQKSKKGSDSTAQGNSNDSEEYNRSILQQMHRIIGDKINQEIGKRVKQFHTCIESCMKLAEIPQAAAVLVNILRGKEDCDKTESSSLESVQKAKELIQQIRDFLGEDQLIQVIHHSLRKLNIARDFFISARSVSVKAKGGETSEDIATSSTLSDEESINSILRSQQLGETTSTENISKLTSTFKEAILIRIIPTLTQFQESINFVKDFESIVA